jgi:hypothetical protein
LGEAKERWKTLCERAVNEEDPEKFVAAIEELIEELESKDQALKSARLPEPPGPGR